MKTPMGVLDAAGRVSTQEVVVDRDEGIRADTTLAGIDYADVPWAVDAPALVMHRMVVDPDVQRGGVASALFQHAEDRARGQGDRKSVV